MRRVVAVLLLSLAACGGDGSLEVTDAWARPTPEVATTAAFYVTFENGTSSDDRLAAVRVDDRCDAAELHRSSIVDGMMQMRPADADDLTIRAGESLVMEPGGVHVMCIGPTAPLVAGDEIRLVFEFAQAGSVETTAVVEDR